MRQATTRLDDSLFRTALLALLIASPARAGDVLAPTTLVSATPAGQTGTGFMRDPALSADGRYVVFWSDASDLVPGDTNSTYDVFLRDQWLGTTEIISLSASGGPCNGPSHSPSISADGRYVCFESGSTNLVVPAAIGYFSIYVRDRLAGTTELVSRANGPNGAQANNTTEFSSISGDGRWVAFGSYADNLTPQKPTSNGFRDLFLRDRLTHVTTLITKGPGGALANTSTMRPSTSFDGGLVAFESPASNLIVGGTTPFRSHVYLYHRATDSITLESKSSGGQEGDASSFRPRIASGGGHVVFETSATNLVPLGMSSSGVAFRLLASGTYDNVVVDSLGQQLAFASWPSVSADGRYVAFQGASAAPGATGGLNVRDRLLGKTLAVCSNDAGNGQSGGAGALAVLSADGTTIVFSGFGQLVQGVAPGDALYARGVGAPLTYCQAKNNSAGCAPRIGFSGEARVSNGFALDVTGSFALNNMIGILIHGLTGPSQVPFAGGTLCVAAPFARSQASFSGGTPPPASDCSGQWTLDLGDVLALSPIGPAVSAGSVLTMQWWGRDTGFIAPQNVQLSDALQVFVGP